MMGEELGRSDESNISSLLIEHSHASYFFLFLKISLGFTIAFRNGYLLGVITNLKNRFNPTLGYTFIDEGGNC